MGQTKRLDYLDMVKGFGIFFVALGHLEDISALTRGWISSFHMPLFFVVSGILIAVKGDPEKDLGELIGKRFKGIIIPYCWFSLSYFLIDILNLHVIKNIDKHTFIVDTIDSLTFYGMSVLWFLPALFLASVGFLFLKKKLNDKLLIFLLLFIAVAAYIIKLALEPLYFANESSLLITACIKTAYIFLRALIAQCFVGYGYYVKKWADRFREKPIKAAAVFSSRITELILGILLLAANIALSVYNGCVDLHNIILNNVPVFFTGAFLGCFGIVLICKAIPAVRLITYFGRNSIIVMACHVNYYFLYAGIKLAWFVDSVNKHARHYVFVAVVMITVFALSSVLITVINRFFPFVLGKRIKHDK